MACVKEFIKKISPYSGIILFVVALFGANIVWKLAVSGDEDSSRVLLFGTFDVSALFSEMSRHIAQVTLACIGLLGEKVLLVDNVMLMHDNGHCVRIIWGCTGIKQTFVFLVIMLLSRGSWKNKLWFIPLGILACYIINIVRITAIIMIVEYHNELFDIYHSFVFKYIYYGLIFLIWLLWDIKIRKWR